MNRRELVKAVAEYTGQEARAVEATVRGLETVVAANVGKGEPVVLSGFAKFARVDRKARMGRNPATGEPVRIKASRKARITALKNLKDVVGGNAPAPKLTAAKPAAAPASKSTAKKATKATAKKSTAKKGTAKKAAAKRTTKAAPKKTAAKKSTAKKSTARKSPAKKTAAKKSTAKKTTAKKATARKSPAKKTAAKRR